MSIRKPWLLIVIAVGFLLIALVLLHDLVIALQNRLDHLLKVVDQVLEDWKVAKIDALMNKTVAKSVLTLHKVEHLWLRESLNADDEVGKVSLLDGLHK